MMLRFAIIFMIALSLAFTTAATYAYGAPASSVIADERKTARINDLTPLSQPILMIVPPDLSITGKSGMIPVGYRTQAQQA